MNDVFGMEETDGMKMTPEVKAPTFDPVTGSETNESVGDRSAYAQAAVETLFKTDISRLDDAGVAGLYRSVTHGMFGFEDDSGAIFGKKASPDMRTNVENLRKFAKGDWKLVVDEEAERWREMSWEEKFAYAREREGLGNEIASAVGGERGMSLGEMVYLGAMSAAQGEMAFTPSQGKPTDGQKEASRKLDYNQMTPEEKKQYESDVIGDYDRKLSKREPLFRYLAVTRDMSDEAAYILAKSYNEGQLDVPQLMNLRPDDAEKVITTFAVMRGDLKEGRILGVKSDFSTGTVGDRFQMGLYGLQQSVVSLGTDLFDLAQSGGMYAYAMMSMSGKEREDFFKAWNVIERARKAGEQELPEAESFGGKMYQSVMENVHWFIPYGGAAKLRGVSAAAAKTATRLSTEAKLRQVIALDKYTRALETASQFERGRSAAAMAGVGVLDNMAFAAFAQEYLETADAEGVSREESVPTAAVVGLVNAWIETMYVPGMESTLTKGELKSLGYQAFVRALKEGEVKNYLKNFAARTITEGTKVGVVEGFVEEPLQEIVKRHGVALDELIAGLGEKEGSEAKRMFAGFDEWVGANLKTYVETAAEMLPASAGFGITTIPGQLMRRRARNLLHRNEAAYKAAHGDEAIVDMIQREREVSRLLEESWGSGGEGKTREEKEVEVTDALTKAREIWESEEGDAVKAIADALKVDVRVAEAVADMLQEEEEVARFDPRARSIIETELRGVTIDEDFAKKSIPGYVEGSLVANPEEGWWSVKIAVPEERGEDWVKSGEKTILYRMSDGVFVRKDGTVDEEAIAAELKDDSDVGKSYDQRMSATGEDFTPWAALGDAEKRRIVLARVNGVTGGGGVFVLKKDDGSEVSVSADAVINLATGRLGDIGYGMMAHRSTVRHETFHALWRFAKEFITGEEVKRIAGALGIDTKADGWEDELDERMAVQYEEYASGHYVMNAMSTRFERFQAWLADKLGGAVGTMVKGANGEIAGMAPFYDAVLAGKLGSGEMGIERITKTAPKLEKEVGVGERSEDKIPVSVGNGEQEKGNGERDKGNGERGMGNGEEGNHEPRTTNHEPPATNHDLVEREEWDQGTTVIKSIPDQEYKVKCKLKVVNIFDGIRTSWDKGFKKEKQGRDITTEESAAKVEKIAGNPDYSRGGRVMEHTGMGAPLVDQTGDVLDGNHHMRGLQEAYRRGGERIEKFKTQVLREAASRGLTVDEHAAEAPIIVCEIEATIVPEGMAHPSVAQIAADTNVSNQRGFNESETAARHAAILIENNLIPRLNIDRETGLIVDGGEQTVNGQIVDPIGVFIQKSGEQGMTEGEGADKVLSEHGQKVLLNAVTMAMFGDNAAVMKSVLEQSEHLDMENELRALMRLAPQLMEIAGDETKKDYDLRPDIVEALQWYREWRDKDETARENSGKTKADWRKRDRKTGALAEAAALGTTWDNFKGDLFARPGEAAQILGDLFAAAQATRSFAGDGNLETAAGKKRAQELIVKEIEAYIENVRAVNTESEDMFGGGVLPSKAEVLKVQREKRHAYSVARKIYENKDELENALVTHLAVRTRYSVGGRYADSKLTDFELAKLYQNDGDQDAAAELVRRHDISPILFNKYKGIEAQDRQDLVDIIWAQVFSDIRKGTLDGEFGFVTMLFNQIKWRASRYLDELERADTATLDAEITDGEGDTFKDKLADGGSADQLRNFEWMRGRKEAMDILEEIYSYLPEDKQNLLRLKSEGWNDAEIAKKSGVTVDVVKNDLVELFRDIRTGDYKTKWMPHPGRGSIGSGASTRGSIAEAGASAVESDLYGSEKSLRLIEMMPENLATAARLAETGMGRSEAAAKLGITPQNYSARLHQAKLRFGYVAPPPKKKMGGQMQKAVELSEQGMSITEVAAELGCTQGNVSILLARAEEVFGWKRPAKKKRMTRHQLAIKELLDQGLGFSEIGRRLGVLPSSVAQSYALMNREFGYVRAEKRMPEKIARIVALREKGYKSREIAEEIGESEGYVNVNLYVARKRWGWQPPAKKKAYSVAVAQKRAGVAYPNVGEEIRDLRFSIGHRRRVEYAELIKKHRPDLEPADILEIIYHIDKYDNPKKEKLAIHWTIAGSLLLPQDEFKLDKALKTAENAHIDPFQFKNPEDIFAKFPSSIPKEKRVDPDKIPGLVNKVTFDHGITVYDLDESEETSTLIDGDEVTLPSVQLAMRRIINTHWGKEASPWCLLRGDGEGKLMRDALMYWEHYRALKKRVAFRNGKLLSFMATDGDYGREEWWDREDESHDGIPFEGELEGDQLGRSARMEIRQDGETEIVGNRWRGNRKNGLYEEWDGDDVKVEESNWKDGLAEGRTRTWTGDGVLTRDVMYVNGEYGAYKKTWYTDGSVSSWKVRLEDGDVESLSFYQGGTLDSYDRTRNGKVVMSYNRYTAKRWTARFEVGDGDGGVKFSEYERVEVMYYEEADGTRWAVEFDAAGYLVRMQRRGPDGYLKDQFVAMAPMNLEETIKKFPVFEGFVAKAVEARLVAMDKAKEVLAESGTTVSPRYSVWLARAKREDVLRPGPKVTQEELSLFAERKEIRGSRRKRAVDEAVTYERFISAYRPLFEAAMKRGEWGPVLDFAERKGMHGAGNVLKRYFREPEFKTEELVGKRIETVEDAAAILMTVRSPFVESIKALYLDRKRQLLDARILTVGQAHGVFIQKGKVTQNMPEKTAFVIFAHNHPSGNPAPSKQDKEITYRIKLELKHSGVKVLDHIITNGSHFYSFNYQDILPIDGTDQKWEVIKNDPGIGKRMQIVKEGLAYVGKYLRDDHSRAGHIIYLTSQLEIRAVKRLPSVEGLGSEEYIRQMIAGVRDFGCDQVILDLGPGEFEPGEDPEKLANASMALGDLGIEIMDVFWGDPSEGRMRSLFSETEYADKGGKFRDLVPNENAVTNKEIYEFPKYSIASRKLDWATLPESLAKVVTSTNVGHLTGQDKLPLDYLEFKTLYRDQGRLADAKDGVEKLKHSKSEPERNLGHYLSGKYYGDLNDALWTVSRVLKRSKVSALKPLLDPKKKVRWVYVRNDDGHRTNRLPEAYAVYLKEMLGGTIDDSIVKTSDERNTGATMKSRVGREFQFDGVIRKNTQYVIVDDVWTTGQTCVSLLDWMLSKGADVRAVTTLAFASNGVGIKPTPERLRDALKKGRISDVEKARELTGVDLNKATDSELLAYIVKGTAGPEGFQDFFGSASPVLPLDFSKRRGGEGGAELLDGASGNASREDGGFFVGFTPEQMRRLWTKPRQAHFSFSVDFPRLAELDDDMLIATAMAAKNALKTKGKERMIRLPEVQKLVEKVHPDMNSSDILDRTAWVVQQARMLSNKIRKDLDAGVSESAILKELNRKLKPVFKKEMTEQARRGAEMGAYGAHAAEAIGRAQQNALEKAVRVQAGVDSDLFEAWAGVDLSETLLKILNNRFLEKDKEKRKRKEEAPDAPEEELGGSGGGEASGSGERPREVKELENPRRFAEYIVDLAAKYWRQKQGLGQAADPWTSRVAVQFLRKTAQKIYTKLVNEITYSKSRDTAFRNILKMDTVPTVPGLVSQMAFVGEIIHAQHIRETQQELCEQIETLLETKLGASGRFKPDKEELRRKVPAEVELRARYMKHAMWLKPQDVSDEAHEIQVEMASLASEYADEEKDVEQSRLYVEAIRKLNILREFGGLRYKKPGEIEQALRYWENLAEGGQDRIIEAFNDREERTKTAAAVLRRAFFNPKMKHVVERGWKKRFNDYLMGHMGFASILSDMMRFADESAHRDAMAVVDYLLREIQKAGDRSALEMRRHSEEFHRAVESIYGKSFKRVMAEMNREAPEFEEFMGIKGGVRVMPTKGRAMQLLVSLLQGAKEGDNYFENVRQWKREGQAERIADLLTVQDLNMIKWLGMWYENNRAELSAVCEDLFGIGVYSESANYFPVRMNLPRQGLEKVEGVGWVIFPKALTPRVKNLRDFDTETDIFAMWSGRMEEAAQWKGHAKLGLELRGIFGRSELQEVIRACHGTKVLNAVLAFITDILSGHGAHDRTTNGIEFVSDQIRGWTALCALGGNVGVTFKQTTSIPAFAFEIGGMRTAEYVVSAFTPAGIEAMKRIFDSEQRKTRWQVGNTEAVKNALSKDDAGWFKRAMQASMITNKIGDVVPGLVVGQGIYRDCIARGMSEENAMAETWMLIERTQQSGRMENQTSVQRRNRLGRMLYQFLTTQQQYLQYEIRAVREVIAQPSVGKVAHTLNVLLLNHFILSSLYYWMGELYKAMLGCEPSEDQLADWAISCLMGPFASLWVFGFACRSTLERYFKGEFNLRGLDMIPMESYIKGRITDAARVLDALFSEDKSADDLLDELARLAAGISPAVRDLRKVIKNQEE